MSSGDWDEVKRLAADFQRAQLTSTSQTLSERNCVEIISKLIELKLLNVVYTTDGKEYITPQYLLKEIKDELYVSGGRVNLVELAKALNVDLSHISARVPEIEKTTPGCTVVNGQLIDKSYLTTIAQEINERLITHGIVTITDLTRIYDLPGDFLQNVVEKNLGKLVHAKQDKSDPRVFFTGLFVEKNKSIVRGALCALTRPTQVLKIVKVCNIEERDFFYAFDSLIEEKQISGVLTARHGGNGQFIPYVYTKQQNEWVENFFRQNGYLEYDALTRLGITEPLTFVRRHFPQSGLLELDSCAIGPSLINQVEAAVEEAIISSSYVDVNMILPSVFGPEDVSLVLQEVLKKSKSKSPTHIFCDTLLVTEKFLDELIKPFHTSGILAQKAEHCVNSGAYVQSIAEKKMVKTLDNEGGDFKGDKREERRKKATGGKSGGGTQGRETKTKSAKKKNVASKGGKGDEDSDSGSEIKAKPQVGKIDFFSLKDVKEALHKNPLLTDLEGIDFDEPFAKYLLPKLNKLAYEMAGEVFERSLVSAAGERRKAAAQIQDSLDCLLMDLRLGERGVKQITAKETQAKLMSHLMRTTATELANNVFVYVGQEHSSHLNLPSRPSEITADMRSKILSEVPNNIKEPLQKLNKALIENSFDDFMIALDPSIAAADLFLRKSDKKKEKAHLINRRANLESQMMQSDSPSSVMLCAVLLLFQSITQNILQASGKFVPTILAFLKPSLNEDDYNVLKTFQDLILKLLTVDDPELQGQINCELNERLQTVKDVVVKFKKQAHSEKVDK